MPSRRAKDAWDRSIRSYDHTGAVILTLQGPRISAAIYLCGIAKADGSVHRARATLEGPHIDHTPPRIVAD